METDRDRGNCRHWAGTKESVGIDWDWKISRNTGLELMETGIKRSQGQQTGTKESIHIE